MAIFGRLLDRRTKDHIQKSVTQALGTKRSGRSGILDTLLRYIIIALLFISLIILAVLIIDIAIDGFDVLSSRLGSFLSGTLRSRSVDEGIGIQQGLVGSFWIAVFVAVFAFPIGIAAAIYLEEYAPKNRLTKFIELNIRNLAGVPSVVYGLLGLFIFVKGFDVFLLRNFKSLVGGSSLAAAGLTLSILVLPIVIITAQEALKTIPSIIKEGAYGVGATKWQVIRGQVLPYAAPGILTGTLLSMSRAIGEAAPLILLGAVTGRLGLKAGLFDFYQLQERFTAMPIIITNWTQKQGRDIGFGENAAAAIVVLLFFVLLINATAILLRNYFEKKRA